jgi:hypothetical protein
MGTWGPGPFQNDTACDFVIEVLESDGTAPLEEEIDGILRMKGSPESFDVEVAVAAAELVARIKGHPNMRAPQSDENFVESLAGADFAAIDAWAKRLQPFLVDALVDKARRVIDRILAESAEFRELWFEPEDFAAWRDQVKDLRERLN